MIDDPNPPTPVARLSRLAVAHGWTTRVTRADGPPVNVVLRLRRGRRIAYGGWHMTPTGGWKWNGGAAGRLRHFPTVGKLVGYIEEPSA